MKSSGLFLSVVAGLLIVAAPGSAQDAPAGADPVAMMMEMLKPTPHHLAMKAHAGEWTSASTFWMDPAAEPMKSTGTASIELLMNGLFMSEVSKADMFGMPWEGRGVYGYDTGLKKHVGVWYDAFGTLMMNFQGDCDGTCNVVSLYSDYMDPMTGTMKRMKSMSTVVDADHSRNELFDVDEKGNETRIALIEYTRK